MREIKRVKFPANGRPGNFPEVALIEDDNQTRFIEIVDGDGNRVKISTEHFRIVLIVGTRLLDHSDSMADEKIKEDIKQRHASESR